MEGSEETAALLEHRLGGAAVEGAMLGRSAWKRPWDVLGDADRFVFGAPTNAAASRRQVRFSNSLPRPSPCRRGV